MDISLHTQVRCTDGLVGKSTHIIVDLVTEQGTHIVVKTKDGGGKYLVPLDKVRSADREVILLNCSKDEFGNLTHSMQLISTDLSPMVVRHRCLLREYQRATLCTLPTGQLKQRWRVQRCIPQLSYRPSTKGLSFWLRMTM